MDVDSQIEAVETALDEAGRPLTIPQIADAAGVSASQARARVKHLIEIGVAREHYGVGAQRYTLK